MGEELNRARKCPKDVVGKVECVYIGHDKQHEEAGRLINDCPINFEWRYHYKACGAYRIRGVCSTRLRANIVAYAPDKPLRPPLGILNACSVAYVVKNLPLKKHRCAVFDGTPDRSKKIEILALGLPKDLRSLPTEGMVMSQKDSKRSTPAETIWKLAPITGDRWMVISAGRLRKIPHTTYMYDSRRLHDHDFNETADINVVASKRRKLRAASSFQVGPDDFPRPSDLEDVNSPPGKHTGARPLARSRARAIVRPRFSPGLKDCVALAHVLAEAKRAELNNAHVFDCKNAVCCLETDPFAWKRRSRYSLVLVLVWRCEKKVLARLACMKDLVAQLAQ